jgi:hypothetical protein
MTPQHYHLVGVQEQAQGATHTQRSDEAQGARVPCTKIGSNVSHPIYKNINQAIIYAPGSSHAYIQQNHQDITTRISK